MIAAGFGFRAAATEASLRDAYERACDGRRAAILAAPSDKVAAACLTGLARALGLPLLPVAPAALGSVPTLTHSPRIAAARDTGSVAEAAALVAAGPRARLLGPRQVSADRLATCALAIGETS